MEEAGTKRKTGRRRDGVDAGSSDRREKKRDTGKSQGKGKRTR